MWKTKENQNVCYQLLVYKELAGNNLDGIGEMDFLIFSFNMY